MTREPFTIITGQPLTWYIGMLILSLVASAVVAALAWFGGELFIAAAVACAVGILWSSFGLFQSTRVEWVFAPDGIAWGEAGLLTRKQRHISADDIAAVGVETRRHPRLPNLFKAVKPMVILDTLTEDIKRGKRRADAPAEGEMTYRLAFRLRNGEVLKIDREQGRADFAATLQALTLVMPRVTWPTLG